MTHLKSIRARIARLRTRLEQQVQIRDWAEIRIERINYLLQRAELELQEFEPQNEAEAAEAKKPLKPCGAWTEFAKLLGKLPESKELFPLRELGEE